MMILRTSGRRVDAGPPVTDGTIAPEIAQALRTAHRRGARIVSICTGASVLAASGLLDAARRCVVPPWREGGQAQYIERPVPEAAGTGTEQTRTWALDRLAEPVSLEHMAAHARMSVRTFTRRFRDETGLSPARWLLKQRVAHARLLLESTDLAVDAVARRSGLGSATALRQHLQAAIGVAPSAYRRTFRLSATDQHQ
jgi:transcriptional regulator GlxA family with amidase domain